MFADNTNSGITSLTATTAYANVKPLVVKGAASQTANLQEWQNSAGTVLTKVQSNGVIDTSQYLNMSTSGNAGIAVGGLYRIRMTGNNTQIEASVGNVATLIVKSAASQTADIQQWQNSSGTVLMAVNSSGAISTGTWNGTAIGATYGGTGLTSYATGDIVYASASNTLSKLSAGTDGYLLTLASGVPTWAAAPISLPTQTNNAGKYLTTDGTTASWATLVVPIETGTATLTANTATTISTTALSAFTSIEYMVSLKQGSKVRTSKVVVQTDGTSVDMTEFAITETGGTMSGVVISATTSGSDAVLQATVTDALAEQYQRKPEAIASRVYGGRMGNGVESTKEGYKFRGRGYIQLTGKDNYTAFGKAINEDVISNPDLVSSKYALLSAAWFFSKNGLHKMADEGSTDTVVTKITKRVNGGTIGLADRIKHFKEYYELLK